MELLNLLLILLLLCFVHRMMNTSPFCTINSQMDPPFITANEFETMGINIRDNLLLQDNLRESYQDVCNECQLIGNNIDECNNNRYCTYLTDKNRNHDQTIYLGEGIEPYHCDIPLSENNYRDKDRETDCVPGSPHCN